MVFAAAMVHGSHFFIYQQVKQAASIDEAESIMQEIYNESPNYWMNGLTKDHFDGGLYLVRKEASAEAVGFVGWQERTEGMKKVGYYSVGIRPKYRRQGFAKQALTRLINIKAAGVDEVRALIATDNKPSQGLAQDLGVTIKLASLL